MRGCRAAVLVLALAACGSKEQDRVVVSKGSGSSLGSAVGSGAGSAAGSGSGSAADGALGSGVETPATQELCVAAAATFKQLTMASTVEGLYPGIAESASGLLSNFCARLPWPTSFATCLAAATTAGAQATCVENAAQTVQKTFNTVLYQAKQAAIEKAGGVAGSGSGGMP